MGQNCTAFLFLCLLMSPGSCLNWMAGGNFTPEEFSILRTKVNAFDITSDPSTYASFTMTLSQQLNELWARAWNAVINFEAGNSDAVVYGYGFNGRWFWQNGIRARLGYVSFIIWKDYNCVQWFTINPINLNSARSSFSPTISEAITFGLRSGSLNSKRLVSDIWVLAQDIQASIPTSGAGVFSDPLAYTVVAAQNFNSFIFGRVCAKDYHIINDIGNDGMDQNGNALILQMRDA